MARLRHLAIKTKAPQRLASFYMRVFELEEVHREAGAIYLSDGYFSLALIPNRGNAAPNGVNHFGFSVADMAQIERRLASFEEPLLIRSEKQDYSEGRAMDPDGNLFDVALQSHAERTG